MHCRVTGRGHIDINRISGYLPGKIVFYLMQVRHMLLSVSVLPNSQTPVVDVTVRTRCGACDVKSDRSRCLSDPTLSEACI